MGREITEKQNNDFKGNVIYLIDSKMLTDVY